MNREIGYLMALIIAVIGIAILMWRDRHGYICSECGKRHMLISGSDTQQSWCDECQQTTEMVKE